MELVKNEAEAPKSEPVAIAEDLLNQLKTIDAVSDISALIRGGMFFGNLVDKISKSQEFLFKLHGKLVADAQAHPDASKVEGLVPVEGVPDEELDDVSQDTLPGGPLA